LGVGLASNLSRSGDAVLVSTNGGVNFWFGWNDFARGTFAAPSVEWGDITTQRDVAIAVAARELGTSSDAIDDGAAASYFYAKGLAWIAADPLRAGKLALH